MHQIIRIHPDAPRKPAEGAACNGCGVCCATAPCPAGAIVSGRLGGACAALVWQAEHSLYRCGLIERPDTLLPSRLRFLAPLLGRLARRFIAAGRGCDCSLEVGG